MTDFIQVITTVEQKNDADKIATSLLELRLVACVQISSCTSKYHWKDALESAEEFVLVMKTRKDLFPILQKTLAGIHPYELPEILATEILGGSSAYLEWLDGELVPLQPTVSL